MERTAQCLKEGGVFPRSTGPVHARVLPVTPYGNVLQRGVELAVFEVSAAEGGEWC